MIDSYCLVDQVGQLNRGGPPSPWVASSDTKLPKSYDGLTIYSPANEIGEAMIEVRQGFASLIDAMKKLD